MESQTQAQKSINKKILVAVLTTLVVVGLVVGVYFWKDGELKTVEADLQTKTDKLAVLEQEAKPKDQPTEDQTGAPVPPAPQDGKGDQIPLSESEVLQVLTTRLVVGSSVVPYWLPIVDKIVGDYAKTAPIPMDYNSEQGYHVPGMGGSTYIWHKKDGAWQKIGQCTESGCEMAEGYEYSKLPKELTH